MKIKLSKILQVYNHQFILLKGTRELMPLVNLVNTNEVQELCAKDSTAGNFKLGIGVPPDTLVEIPEWLVEDIRPFFKPEQVIEDQIIKILKDIKSQLEILTQWVIQISQIIQKIEKDTKVNE